VPKPKGSKGITNWNNGKMEWWNIGYIRVPSGLKIL
jgi:hypothetical protein